MGNVSMIIWCGLEIRHPEWRREQQSHIMGTDAD
jgi:hypothetical protein